jgi:hypothetical protein
METDKQKSRRKPKKGALIKGISGRLPIEILESPVFTADIKKVMRGFSGIYLLYKRKTLYYVGLATNLLGRLRSHQKDKHARKWDQFEIYRIKKTRFLKDVETMLIGVLRPPGNSVEGRVLKDADINKILRKVLKQQESSMSKIRKTLLSQAK